MLTFARRRTTFVLVVVVALAGCAGSPTQSQSQEQAELTSLAQPYAAQLSAAGVTRVETPAAGGTMMKVMSNFGPFDLRYRADLPPAPFVVVVTGPQLMVYSNSYTSPQQAQYREAMAWALPEVLRRAPSSEAGLQLLQNDSGRGGR